MMMIFKGFTPFLLLFMLFSCGSSKGGKNGNLNKLDQNTTWQWQLNGKIDTSYKVKLYDIDLFDTPKKTIEKLHKDGKIVICYFSAGSYEKWRDDALRFPKEALGKKMDGWDERWLDIRNEELKKIMIDRIKLAKEKGCDGVEPDNVDGYTNKTGFKLTYNDQLSYNIFLAKEAHKLGLLIGLKNDLDQIKELVEYFDFALNEQCHEFDECKEYEPFIKKSKPVFNAEYKKRYIDDKKSRERLCKESIRQGIRTLILPLELDNSFRISCDK